MTAEEVVSQDIGKVLIRPVSMEGQRYEIPEDPSQTLPERSPVDPIW